ncbi:MAG: hypothetical protein ACE5E1_05010 [Phycisphaerae bacterium]
MRDNRNLAIVIFSVTAAVLLVGLFLTPGAASRNQALAIGQIDRGGDYIMVTGQFTENSELVYVIDAAARRLNSYSYETTNRQIILWQSLGLGQLSTPRR